MQGGRRCFPLQLPTYTAEELDAHVDVDHPKCQFCGTHFYEEEQWELHMARNHPYCELCDADFRNAGEFTDHLRSVPHGFAVEQFHTLRLQFVYKGMTNIPNVLFVCCSTFDSWCMQCCTASGGLMLSIQIGFSSSLDSFRCHCKAR